MRGLFAFVKKEWMELVRSGKLVVLSVLFVMFGLMNPAIAKLTPRLMETMSDSLENTGLIVTEVHVDVMTSWVQFYKNVPIALLVFVLFISSSFTAEYQKGTLVIVLAKGLSRWKVYMAKAFSAVSLWAVGYFLCFGITYWYNDFYWDNSIAGHPFFAAALIWLFGVWIISLLVFFSGVLSANTTVLAATGGCVLVSYFVGMFPKCGDFLPTKLLQAEEILSGMATTGDYNVAIIVTIILSFVALAGGLCLFHRKKLL